MTTAKDAVSEATHQFSIDKCESAKFMLKQYFDSENALVDGLLPQSVTGLSSTLVEVLATGYDSFSSRSVLDRDYPNLKDIYKENISTILTFAQR